jgi:hypothetical protein
VSLRGWIVLADVLREAGSRADPAEALRDVGAAVTRNSRAQWIADPKDPRVKHGMRDLTESADDGG